MEHQESMRSDKPASSTPGPWIWHERFRLISTDGYHTILEPMDNGFAVWNEADRALIASAPSLLEALESIANDKIGDYRLLVSKAKEAIEQTKDK